jgi:tellurium resistance protein TerD
MSRFNLKKGQRFDLTKSQAGLRVVRIGLGWTPNQEADGPDFDLDVSAFAIGVDHKIVSDSHFVFYGQVKMGNMIADPHEQGMHRPISNDGAIMGAIDDPDGMRSTDGDDEDMIIELSRLDKRIQQVIICVTICKYPDDRKKDHRTLNLNFGMLSDCYVRLMNNESSEELVRYELNETFTNEDVLEFARLFWDGESWQFEAMGRGHLGGLPLLVGLYAD